MKTLYKVAHIEGWSYLLLLVVAMPLKYGAGIDIAVRIVGSIHGILFVALLFVILRNYFMKKLNFISSVLIMLASLVPFATFYSERIVIRFNRNRHWDH